MDYNNYNYKIIQMIKKSEKAEVLFAAVDGMDAPVVVKRLYEANPEIYRVISEIHNVHIPRIYDIREEENELIVVEEYVDGKTLDAYMSETVLSDIQKMELMVQLCEALEILHGCTPPVIHRDIKPTNILVNEEGILKIIDFDASRQYKGNKNTSDTRLLGTIEYAAPEQFGYAQTDFRSDIYSAGVVFSELELNRKSVFFKEWKHLVDKCTSFDPKNRYKNVAELKKDLQKCIRKEKQAGRKKGIVPAVAGLISFIILIVGGLQIQSERNKEVLLPDSSTSKTQLTEVPKASNDPEAIQETLAPDESERTNITEAPKAVDNPEDADIVLEDDRLVWKNRDLPVTAQVRESAMCSIVEVYVCRRGDERDPFSELLIPLARESYEVSADGKQLRLSREFLEQYDAEEDIVFYIVFDDGRGERLWIICKET